MRLEELAEREGANITIEWKTFLLRPEPEERSMEQFVEYTKSWERPAEMEPRAPFFWPWSGLNEPPAFSVPAAVAGKAAETFGDDVWHRFHRRLLEAYFVENRTVSDVGVLTSVAEDVGIDGDAYRTVFNEQGPDLTQRVLDVHHEALQRGVNGVPAVVVDDRYLISGAVDVDHYVAALARYREILSEESAAAEQIDDPSTTAT